jgi:hypothetical protein
MREDIVWKRSYEAWLWRYFKLREIKTSIEAGQVIAREGLWKSQHGCRCSRAATK